MKRTILLLAVLSSSSMADNGDICRGYNFVPDTPEYSNCLMQLHLADRQQAQQQAAQRQEAMLRMYRPIVIPPLINYQMPVPQQRPQINCRWIGNVWNCQ